MATDITSVFDGLSRILCVCPCCGDIFYVSEAHPYLQGRQPHSFVDDLRGKERKLDRAEERLDETESELRKQAARAGERKAKRLLKKIDPVFSGSGYDPQDVKVLFDPVSYVIFDGMAHERLKRIVLLGKEPESAVSERIYTSIDRAIEKGNMEFRTLRVGNDGRVAAE